MLHLNISCLSKRTCLDVNTQTNPHQMTGDDNLTQIHVEAALQQCSTFVLLNMTLQEAEPEVTYTIESICPNNCSSHGDCNGGKYPYTIEIICPNNCSSHGDCNSGKYLLHNRENLFQQLQQSRGL
jgi:hypothetical protein